jgi:hypothetical protein
MGIKPWEAIAALVGALFGLLLVIGGGAVFGIAIVCADALWLLTRVSIRDRLDQPPGRHARMRGRLGLLKLLLIFGVYGCVAVGGWLVQREDNPDERVSQVAVFALAGLAFLLLREAKEAADDAFNWLLGARAESAVGRSLEQLRKEGWLVVHGYSRGRLGDIDHVACGPGGVYAIETKSYRFRRGDLRRTAWNAAWLKRKLGVSWVDGVLCVNEQRVASREGQVWVVGHDELVDWIRARQRRPLDPGLAARLLAADAEAAAVTEPAP